MLRPATYRVIGRVIRYWSGCAPRLEDVTQLEVAASATDAATQVERAYHDDGRCDTLNLEAELVL